MGRDHCGSGQPRLRGGTRRRGETRGFGCLALTLALGLLTRGEAGAEELSFSGYFKTVAMASQAPDVPESSLSFNRLRLQLKGELASGVSADLQYDNDYVFGSHLDTAPLLAAKNAPNLQFWNAQATYVDTSHDYGSHRLYRASVTLAIRHVDIRVGRQRIAWGTGRFWSPLDILNPVNPAALDREERPGADAVLLEAKTGPLSRVSAVYAPQKVDRLSSGALQWHDNARGIDYSVVAGRLLGEDVVGFDLATQIGQAGLRGELTHQRPESGSSFSRAMLGIDYAFPNTLVCSLEAYYNGAGSSDFTQYRWADALSGRMVSLATRYWGLFMSYELTPLLKSNNYVVYNADDNSRGIDIRLVWSVRTNVDLSLGGRSFSGIPGSEYGRLGNSVFAQAQWYF